MRAWCVERKLFITERLHDLLTVYSHLAAMSTACCQAEMTAQRRRTRHDSAVRRTSFTGTEDDVELLVKDKMFPRENADSISSYQLYLFSSSLSICLSPCLPACLYASLD